jgi:hypothetical protein
MSIDGIAQDIFNLIISKYLSKFDLYMLLSVSKKFNEKFMNNFNQINKTLFWHLYDIQNNDTEFWKYMCEFKNFLIKTKTYIDDHNGRINFINKLIIVRVYLSNKSNKYLEYNPKDAHWRNNTWITVFHNSYHQCKNPICIAFDRTNLHLSSMASGIDINHTQSNILNKDGVLIQKRYPWSNSIATTYEVNILIDVNDFSEFV